MENDLTISIEQIVVKQGTIEFNEYENIKQQALQLAAQIETVQVNDENLKQSKKLLAAVNKRLKELEDRRISIKKMMLEPYSIFETQVKEIVSIVKEADATVRNQVKDLEEAERFCKEVELMDLFELRLQHYSFKDLVKFTDFLKPNHLNKTTTINAVENEMIAFFEKTEKDMNLMRDLPDSNSYVSAYLGSFDLGQAMTKVNREKDRKRRIEASQAKRKNGIVQKTFTVYDDKDFLLVEMYMNNNDIKFTVEEGA